MRAVFEPASSMKAIHVPFTAALLVGGLSWSNCWGQALSEKEYLTAVLPLELIRYAGIEVPSRENIQILSDPVGPYLEFRLVPGQAKKNNGIRAEISVDYPYGVGDIVRYKWEMRLPGHFKADEPRNRWWVMGQWHDQPDRTKGETWQGFPAHSPPVAPRRKGLSLVIGRFAKNEERWAPSSYARHLARAGRRHQMVSRG
jgi:hypothetical protein